MKNSKRLLRALLAATLLERGVAAAVEDSFQFFQQEAVVVTSSRRPQAADDSPVAVEVITAEEIRRSGAVDLWDLLRFKAGIDVLNARSDDGNRAIVSVRGFPSEFVASLQVLLDGRSVYYPVNGGVYWQQLPVQLQDIERIEIVRGPAAALYGSNAGLGVVNIITKRPERERTAEGSAQGGGYGRNVEAAALEDAGKAFGYRLSGTRHEEGGFPRALGGASDDWLRSNKGNARGYWDPRPGTDVEFFAGSSWEKMGVTDLDPGDSVRFNDHFEMIKLSQKTVNHGQLEVFASHQWNASFESLPANSQTVSLRQYDLDALHRLDWLDGRLNTTAGGNLRYMQADSAQFFTGMRAPSNRLVHGFLEQSAKVSRRVSVVAAGSIEDSQTGGRQTAAEVSLILHPRPGQTFRATYSNSTTIPDLFRKYIDITASPVHFTGNLDLQPEKITNYELGYEGYWLDRRLKWEERAYSMYLNDIATRFTQSVTFFPTFMINETVDNRDAATARGVESAVSYRLGRQALYANYAYEYIDDGQRDDAISAGTPHTKVNMGGTFDLGHGFSAALNAGIKSGYFIQSDSRGATAGIPADWRLDARLAYRATRALEVFVAGQNLTRPGRSEFADGLEIPTVVSGGVTMRLGSQ